jgi:hypothetical protein
LYDIKVLWYFESQNFGKPCKVKASLKFVIVC